MLIRSSISVTVKPVCPIMKFSVHSVLFNKSIYLRYINKCQICLVLRLQLIYNSQTLEHYILNNYSVQQFMSVINGREIKINNNTIRGNIQLSCTIFDPKKTILKTFKPENRNGSKKFQMPITKQDKSSDPSEKPVLDAIKC